MPDTEGQTPRLDRTGEWLRAQQPRFLVALALVAGSLLLLDEWSGITQPFQRLAYLLDRGMVRAAVYSAVAAFLAVLSLLLMRSRLRSIAVGATAIFILSTALELSFNLYTGSGLSEDIVAISLRELGMAPNAAKSYFDLRVALIVFGAVVFWTGVYHLVRRRRLFGVLVPGPVSLTLVAILVVLSTGWRMRFEHFRMYPLWLRPVFNVTDYYIQGHFIPDREAPQIRFAKRPTVASHIVFIVDESVRPDYLSLNGFPKPTTPFLSSIGHQLINFGIASSGSTCSYASNVLLNSYVRPHDVQDRHAILTRPTIFYFAKQAGYRTVLLSAVFRSPLFYGIRKSDLQDIDEVVMINLLYEGAKHLNDQRLVTELAKLLAAHRGEKMFVYVRKQGTHFPFDEYYPDNGRLFQPVLGNRQPNRDNEDRVLNSYLNGIRWNLDEFYRMLDAETRDAEAVYLYTSDHGENVELEGKGLFHCGSHRNMAMVPLWLDIRGDITRRHMQEAFGQALGLSNRGHASHMDIFPTLLSLMNVQTDDLTLFDDLTKRVREFYLVAARGTYRGVPFD